MTTRLEELIKSIGGCAIMYINGSLVDKEQTQVSFKKFFELTDSDELTSFINDIIEKACGNGVKLGTDILGRRAHLEYICSVYKFARLKLNDADELSEEQWDKLNNSLYVFLENFKDLMNHDKKITFNNIEYKLKSLKHQTVAGYIPFASKTGNLGACLNDYVFKFLVKPNEQPFFSQIGKLIQDEKILVAGKLFAKNNKLLGDLLDIKPQIKALTLANLKLVEQNKMLEGVGAKQNLEIGLLEKKLSKIQKQLNLLTEKQSDISSNQEALTQFGFLAPKPISTTIVNNQPTTPEIL